jgi:hypothetical protein
MAYQLTPAEKKRRRDLAKELGKKIDPITGRRVFGGPQPGSGRPRKKRATEVLNEKIEDHADEIWDAMYRALNSNKPFVALQAAKQMVEISKMETDYQMKEERSLEDTPTEELVELVARRFARLADSGIIPYDIDGEAVEVEPEALGRGSDEDNPGEVTDQQEGTAEVREAASGLGASAFARRTPR